MIENELKAILEKTFECKQLHIENQSGLHAGHASSPNTGESHFYVHIVANDFIGKTRLEAHQMVNQAVSPLFDKGLHALSVKAKAPLNS
tara:strand:+ start:86 stop:352 length:267 start_codon:yes stop_codon:yes gene_type:complete